MFANASTTDGLEERYRAFGGWGMTAGIVEVLLVVCRFDVDRGAFPSEISSIYG